MTVTAAHDPDVGRRVIQCACERTATWHGPEHARRQGWASRWTRARGGKLARTWACPEHAATGPTMPPQPGRFRLPLPSLDEALTQPARALALVELHLEAGHVDMIGEFFESLFLERRRELAATSLLWRWEDWARARGFEPPPPPPRRHRGRRRG